MVDKLTQTSTALKVATIAATIAIVFLLGAFAFKLIVEDRYKPFFGAYDQPRMVQSRVSGIEGPAVKVNGILTVRVSRCINTDKITSVTVFEAFYAVPPFEHSPVSIYRGEPQSRSSGCIVTESTYTLPNDVTPGRWRIFGIDTAPNGDQARWFSEDFEVVP